MSQEVTSIQEAVDKQFRAEAHNLRYEESQMVRQKYGLVPPQLTLSEMNLIRREDHKRGRK